MDSLLNPEFWTRHLTSACYVAVPAAVLLGVGSTYRSRVAAPSAQAEDQTLGEFRFHNGLLIPHQEYLYGYSEGQHFIVGKKVAGHDYSAWEAGYKNFAKPESVIIVDSGVKSTWAWSVEGTQSVVNSNLSQLLPWLLLGVLCVLLGAYVAYKVGRRLSRGKHGKKLDPQNIPSVLDAENINSLWRKTVIDMFCERKRDIVSLSELVVHYYESSCNFRNSATKEKEEKDQLKGELDQLKEDHALELAKCQREMESLRQTLDDQTSRADELEHSNNAVVAHNVAANETIKNLEEQIQALHLEREEAKDVADQGHEQSESAVRDETYPVPAEAAPKVEGTEDVKEQAAGQDETSPTLAEAAPQIEGTEDAKQQATEQDETPAPENRPAGVKVAKDGKPYRPRANRRADGTIRNPKHPNFVPRAVPQAEAAPKVEGTKDSEEQAKGQDETPPVPAEATPKVEGTENAKEQATGQDETSVPEIRPAGVKLAKDGKPHKPRANRRADGTIRSANHPDFVPRAVPQPVVPPLPQGGNGFGRGGGVYRGLYGGRGYGEGPFIWRGGRGGRGVGGYYPI